MNPPAPTIVPAPVIVGPAVPLLRGPRPSMPVPRPGHDPNLPVAIVTGTPSVGCAAASD